MGYQAWKASFLHWIKIRKWMVVLHECDKSIHILPLADDIIHELHDCVCGPTEELHDQTWMHIHHSLDGRERNETRAKTP